MAENKVEMEDFTYWKKWRMERCTCRVNSKYLCKKCRQLKRHMCRSYHLLTNDIERHSPIEIVTELATKELYARILYEYTFDIVDFSDIINIKAITSIDSKKLLSMYELCIQKHVFRDKGHQMRIDKLFDIVNKRYYL